MLPIRSEATAKRRVRNMTRHLATFQTAEEAPTAAAEMVGAVLGVSPEELAKKDLQFWLANAQKVLDELYTLDGITMIPNAKFAAAAEAASAAHSRSTDLHALIEQAAKEPTGARVAVIGVAISGIQAMKACLAEGIEPVGFEADSDVGGFWRFKEDANHPSVYR